ncbi:MAG: hypothetical protein IJ151_05760 [Bacteroidales bacterium]|nr:hypothetical protein [Bacteroidales bacterium]
MKKILVVCAALLTLPCLLVHAQEADDTENGIVLNVIPRLEYNNYISTAKGGENDSNFGNSALYTLFEGNITDNLSFSLCNHWLSREPKYLYKNTLHSDDVNWMDWGYLTYTIGNWEISAGKQVVTLGGFEFDDNDYDVHAELNSNLWNILPVYEWGGKVSYNATENNTFSLQMTTSPYGHRPIKSGLYNYSGEWRSTFGNVESILSFTMLQTMKLGDGNKFFDCFNKVVTLGLQADVEPVVLRLDMFNKVGLDDDLLMVKGLTVLPSVLWPVNEKVELLCKAGFEHMNTEIDGIKQNSVNVGAALHWTPLKDKALRFHLTAAYNSGLEVVPISAGVLYNFSIKVK